VAGDNGEAGAEGQPPQAAFPKGFEGFLTKPSKGFQRCFCTGF
jgi:hypothetical protein